MVVVVVPVVTRSWSHCSQLASACASAEDSVLHVACRKLYSKSCTGAESIDRAAA